MGPTRKASSPGAISDTGAETGSRLGTNQGLIAALTQHKASYSVSDWSVRPTYDTPGAMWVRVTNTSTITWRTGEVALGYHLYYADQRIYNWNGFSLFVDVAVPPNYYVDLYAVTEELPAGSFTLFFDMRDMTDPDGKFFKDFGAPASRAIGFTVPHYAPSGSALSPLDGATIGTLSPELSIWVGRDGTTSGSVQFQVCKTADATGCITSSALPFEPSSSFGGIHTWPVYPTLYWNTTYYWRFKAADTYYPSPPWSGMSAFTTIVPESAAPTVGGEQLGSITNLDAAGVNVFSGNYVRTETDLKLPTPQSAIPLRIERTYNSSSTATGVFGLGWSSILDASARSLKAGFVTVTLPDGRQVTYGQNPDGSYAGPYGDDGQTKLRQVGAVMTLSMAGGTEFAFGNLDGRISELRAPDGDVLRFVQNSGTTRLDSITSTRSGRSLYLTWLSGRVVKVSTSATPGAEDRTWSYTYSATQLTKVCDAEYYTNCTTYTYGATSTSYPVPRLTLVQRPNAANKTSIGYFYSRVSVVGYPPDANGNQKEAWRYAVQTATSERGGPVIQVIDPTGVNVFYEFGSRGELWSRWTGGSTPTAGKLRAWAYDVYGRVSAMLDENWNPTEYVWSLTNGQLSGTRRYRNSDEIIYTGYNYLDDVELNPDPRWARNLVELVDGNLDKTVLTYWNGQVTSRTTPATPAAPTGERTTYTYTCQSGPAPAVVNDPGAPTGSLQPCGLLSTMTDPVGRVTRYGYNRFGDRTELRLPTGASVTNRYSAFGDVEAETVITTNKPSGVTTTFRHDTYGRIRYRTEPVVINPVTSESHQRVLANYYDGDGNLVSQQEIDQVDPDVSAPDPTRSTTYAYDGRDRLTEVRRNGTVVSQTEYDGMGHVTRNVDAAGADYRHAYDPVGRLASVTLVNHVARPGAAARSVRVAGYGYDPAGRVTSYTNAMGRTVGYSYTTDDLIAEQVFRQYLDPATNTRRDIVLHRYTYDKVGNLSSDVSGSGSSARTTTYTYDKAHRPTSKTVDPGGLKRTTSWAYDRSGLPLTTTVSDGSQTETTTNVYSAGGELLKTGVRESAQADLVTQYATDGMGNLLSVTDPRGVASLTSTATPDAAFTTNYAYDDAGRLGSVTQPAVSTESGDGSAAVTTRPVTTFGYNAFGEMNSVRDARGLLTRAWFDSRGRMTDRRVPDYRTPAGTILQPTEQWAYDNADNVVSYQPPGRPATTMAYDTRGRLYRMTEPPAVSGGQPGLTDYTYDDDGNTLSVTDPAGGQTISTFDELDRLLVQTRGVDTSSSEADVRTHRYDDFGDLTAVIFDDARIDRTYNKAGELLTDSATGRGTVTYTRDLAGRPTAVTDPMNRRSETFYDLAGRAVETRHISGGTIQDSTSYVWDKASNLTAVLDARDNFWRSTYDALNRQTSRRDPASHRADGTNAPSMLTTFGYDALGNRTRVTDAKDQSTYETYNALNLPETTVEPATTAHPAAVDRTWTRTYDAAGTPVRIAEPGGVVVTADYDQRGRTIAVSGTGGSAGGGKTFGYDQLGRLTSAASDGGPAQTFTYDTLGQLLTADGPSGTSSLRYDELGRIVEENAGPVRVTYGYSGFNLRTLTDHQAQSVRTYDRNAAGQVTTESQRSIGGVAGPTRTLTYDPVGRVASDTTRAPGGTLTASLAYSWDAVGNLTSQTTGGQLAAPRTASYQYDEANRLIRASDSATGDGSDYAWDAVGNRTGVTAWTGANHTAVGTTTATFDARNRISGTSGTASSASYRWTPRGTLESVVTTTGGTSSTRTTSYDAFNRLIGDSARSFSYDALDRLSSAGTGGTRSSLNYSGLRAEPSGDGQFSYARSAEGRLLSSRPASGGSASNLLSTVHGDVVARTDPATGAVSDSRSFDSFGRATGGSSLPNVGFQGSWTDPGTGKVSQLARWYDPELGSFSSRDSWDVPVVNAAASNRYLYGSANPTSRVDPTGHFDIGLPALGTVMGFLGGAAESVGIFPAAGGGAAAAGGAAACALLCWAAIAVGVVAVTIAVGVVVYYALNSPSTVPSGVAPNSGGKGSPQTAGGGQSAPTPTPRTDPAPQPPQPRIDPPKVWVVAGGTTSWQTTDTWYDDTYLYTRTNTYSYTTMYEYTYYDGNTWMSGSWNTPTQHTWTVVAKPLIDFSNPIKLPTPVAGKPQAGSSAAPASDDGGCGTGGSLAGCGDRLTDLPPGAQTDAGGGGGKPPVAPPTSNCSPEPEGEDWVDPEDINFSQRTVSPNDYLSDMLSGAWDWNRPGAPLRVLDRGGQLVSYDNRRLDAARAARAQDPTYRVRVERVDPLAPNPEKGSGMNWDKSFEKRMKSKRNQDENGCRVPWQGLYERPGHEKKQ
ncbi:DUF6531 domain-containing protein [Micromonospora sp. NPDC000089]|uniref:DUF6531 domain-containing protein n=1 Tax=unclassified Micromonospora TaxID=2617518 RepID=UPI003693D238